MVRLKTVEDIEQIRESGRRLARVLAEVKKAVKPGVKTVDLDTLAYDLIKKMGDKPAFLNYRPAGADLAYPASLCTSVNEQIVHGIPSQRVLKEGDIIGLDLGLEHNGYFTDMAVTVPVGRVKKEVLELIHATEESLYRAIEEVKVGQTLGDIGYAVQSFAESRGYSVVRDLCGHGVGFAIHEDPLIPNFGKPGKGEKLKVGMVLAIEPMVNLGRPETDFEDDGFTFSTADGSLSAHFEHTVALTEKGVEILTKV